MASFSWALGMLKAGDRVKRNGKLYHLPIGEVYFEITDIESRMVIISTQIYVDEILAYDWELADDR